MANIEFIDRKFGHIRVPASRKIKFKQVSFTNISERFNNFRLNRLKSKLISDKEKLVSMEFKGSQLVPGTPREKVERKVLNKTAAIAKLESKINFLETGNYLTEEFVNSRAIKLKEKMMQNLEYNRSSLYGVNETIKEAIINDKEESVIEDVVTPIINKPEQQPSQDEIIKKQMLEQQEQIAEEVKKIMSEGDNRDFVAKPLEPVTENETDYSEIEFSKNTAEESQIENQESTLPETINVEDLAAAIDGEMKKIKITRNESSPAKVNKFVNEDGTYRLKREDIDEDFRITRIDGKPLQQDLSLTTNDVNLPEIAPFAKSVTREAASMSLPRKSLTEMPDVKKHVIEPIQPPTIKQSFFESLEGKKTTNNSSDNRELALVAPERNVTLDKTETKAPVVNLELSDGIQAYFNKVTVLTKDMEKIESEYAHEAQAIQNTDERYGEMLEQFVNYVNSLEEQCNESYKELQQMREDKETKENQINAMINMMAQGFSQKEIKKARHK